MVILSFDLLGLGAALAMSPFERGSAALKAPFLTACQRLENRDAILGCKMGARKPAADDTVFRVNIMEGW